MKFSIIIPVYNVAPYLRECLDSVLAQTFTDWEAICVDDGSTDASGAILDEYAAKDARFKVIHQPNAGVSAARNRALENAQGEWIGFADPDDVLHREWLSNFKQLIDSQEVDIVHGGYTIWNGVHPLPEVDGGGGGIRLLAGDDARFKGAAIALKDGYAWLNVIRRSLMEDLRFPNVRVLEDCLFSSSAMLRAKSVAITDFPGYYYRVRPDSAVHKLPPGRNPVDDLIELTSAVESWYVDNRRELGKAMEPFLLRMVASFVYGYLMSRGMAQRRSLVGRHARYQIVARQLRGTGFVGEGKAFSSLPFYKRMPLFLFVRTGCWLGLLLNWKVAAGWHKARCAWQRFLSRRNRTSA